MSEFKVGDWVTINGTLPNDKFQLTNKEVEHGEILLAHFSFTKDTWTHWQPKEGEWCWIEESFAQYIRPSFCVRPNGTELTSFGGFDSIEPFIGELPSFLKDK